MTKVQNDTGLSLKDAYEAMEGDGVDINIGPTRLWVPAAAVAEVRDAWSVFRAEAGEDAARQTYEGMAATLDERIKKAVRAFEADRPLDSDFMDRLVHDLVWRQVVVH